MSRAEHYPHARHANPRGPETLHQLGWIGLHEIARTRLRSKLIHVKETIVCDRPCGPTTLSFTFDIEDGLRRDGKFCWPGITDGVVRLTAAQLQALLEGLQEYPCW